jgi:hypothetical protein
VAIVDAAGQTNKAMANIEMLLNRRHSGEGPGCRLRKGFRAVG